MYDVDTKKIAQLLSYSDTIYVQVQDLYERIQTQQYSIVDLLAAERVLLLFFDVFTDVTNLLIDGFVMRDPGGYEDMVDILDDEQVVSASTSSHLRELIRFYRAAIKDYSNYSTQETANIFLHLFPNLRSFAEEVRRYVQAELPNNGHI